MVEKLTKMASKAVEANEKPALQSKKFVAFLVTEMGFFVLMGIMLGIVVFSKAGGGA